MRIVIHKDNYSETEIIGTLQTDFERVDGSNQDYFIVTDGKYKTYCFQYCYATVLGCDRLFLYDPIAETLRDFMAEDFQTFGNWLLDYLDEYFPTDFAILY